MEKFWVLILVAFFATNSLDKAAESVQLEETPLNPLDEIFGEGWWDNEKDEEWHNLTLEQNFHHQIDRQNTQLGQIEPNSTDQNPPLTESDHFAEIEPNSTDQNPPLTETDHFAQIKPNSTDQNPPLTETDHSDNAKNSEKQNKIMKEITSNKNNAKDERKHKILGLFNAMKEEFKQKGKYSSTEWTKIETEISTNFGVKRRKIYKWKKEFGLSRKVSYTKEERKHFIEQFDQMKAELKRSDLKNSYPSQIAKTVAKELGLNFGTIYRWKRKLGQTKPNKLSHSEQTELMKRYYEIKEQYPKISDKNIAKMLKIGRTTLVKWKRQFK